MEDFIEGMAWAQFQQVICREADDALAECLEYLGEDEDRWFGFATAFVIMVGSTSAFEERYPDAPMMASPLWAGSLASHLSLHAYQNEKFKRGMQKLERIIDIRNKAGEN